MPAYADTSLCPEQNILILKETNTVFNTVLRLCTRYEWIWKNLNLKTGKLKKRKYKKEWGEKKTIQTIYYLTYIGHNDNYLKTKKRYNSREPFEFLNGQRSPLIG